MTTPSVTISRGNLGLLLDYAAGKRGEERAELDTCKQANREKPGEPCELCERYAASVVPLDAAITDLKRALAGEERT